MAEVGGPCMWGPVRGGGQEWGLTPDLTGYVWWFGDWRSPERVAGPGRGEVWEL